MLCIFCEHTTGERSILFPTFLFVVLQSSKSFIWPDAAVPAITALEKVSNDALSADFQKYNQKMRQLVFNLKVRNLSVLLCQCILISHNTHQLIISFSWQNTRLLAQRLLNGELEPSKILNMSPNELKVIR